jgi:hypothetical protein
MNDKPKKGRPSENEMEREGLLERMEDALESARLAPKEIKTIMAYFAHDDHNPGIYTDLRRNAADSTDPTQRKLIVVVDWLKRPRRQRRPTKIVIVSESEQLPKQNSTE